MIRTLLGPVKTALLLVGLLAALAVLASVIVTSPAHAEGGCPNEQLRAENHSTALPDCRAYELVSPPFKFGEGLSEELVAPSGAGVLFTSLGAFGEPGDNAAVTGPNYLATRAGGGWSSAPEETSVASFEDPLAETSRTDASSDLGEILLERAPKSSKVIDRRLYILHSSGELVEVGPEIPAARIAAWTHENEEKGEMPELRYAGASPDLSHILFTSERAPNPTYFLWPGDETVAFGSLYEYVGVGHSGVGGDVPALVGVNNAGHLISQCGTVLGAGNTEQRMIDGYNAISEKSATAEADVTSEEGARVFFTATRGGCRGHAEDGAPTIGTGPPVNELYARVNGSRTVAISEPSKEDCAACDTSEIEGTLTQSQASALQAVFQGASSDGSKVFFLSRQKLLAGAEGINLYEYDFDAEESNKKVTLIAAKMSELGRTSEVTVSGVVRVSENGERVYFVSEEGEALAGNRDSKGAKAVVGTLGEPRSNLFMYDTVTGQYVFVGELASGDSHDWSVEDHERQAEATPDGDYLVFASRNDLTPDANGSGVQLYRYDAQAGEADATAEAAGDPVSAASLVRVSIGEDGTDDDGNAAELSEIRGPEYSVSAYAHPPALSISDDGSKIFFESAWALTPGALNDVCVAGDEIEGTCEEYALPAQNIYEWENGHVYLLSDGKDRGANLSNPAVHLIGADPSGNDVFLTTADPLVSSDTDTVQDVYDARVDGGFPAPPLAAGCSESCQGSPGAPPQSLTPLGSATFAGAGNLVPPAVAPAVKPKAKTKPKRKAAAACKSRKASRSSKKTSRTCKSKARKARNDRRHGR